MSKKELKKIIIIFLLSRLLLLAFLIIKKDISILTLYDGEHYINIAVNGYQEQLLYAFFPLFPLLIRLLHFIIPSYEIAGLLISNICSFMSLIILNKLIKDKENKFINLVYLAFSPILAYTTIVYTESLFMLLTLLGYYLYKKDKYLLAGIIVGLTILCRNSGIILWGAIGLDMLIRLFKMKDIKFRDILVYGIISLAIGMIYPTYLYINTGNPLMFATIQKTYWHRESMFIIDGIIADIMVIKRSFNLFTILIFLENWVSFFLVLILGIKIFKKDRVSSIYIIVSLFAFSLTYRDINYWVSLASSSLFRYVFNLFPIYLYAFNSKNKYYKLIMAALILFVTIFNTLTFYLGGFLG